VPKEKYTGEVAEGAGSITGRDGNTVEFRIVARKYEHPICGGWEWEFIDKRTGEKIEDDFSDMICNLVLP